MMDLFTQIAFHRLHPSVRWVSLGLSTAWLPPQGDDLVAQVAFVDRRQQLTAFELLTGSGQHLDAVVTPIEKLGSPLDRFNNEPDDAKSFFRVEFHLDGPDVVVARSESVGELFSLVPRIVSPSFLFDILQITRRQLPDVAFATLVETGTLYAHTAFHASHWFERVISIELDESLHGSASALGLDGVEFLHGDSGVVIPQVVDRLESPTVFFLDAHWSGDASVNWSDSRFRGFPTTTAHLGVEGVAPSSPEQVPLDREVDAIVRNFPDYAVIIIDDWESIGAKDHAFEGEDWTHISKQALRSQCESSGRLISSYRYDAKHFVVVLGPIV